MKNCPAQNNSFNNMSTIDKTEFDLTSTTEEDNCSTATNSNTSNNKFRTKIRKRSNDICYTLNYYEKYGNIYVSHHTNKIFIAKLRKINFDDNFQELFEKGKSNIGNYFKEDVTNIPDITFWYQRYYYYKRFDEGIQMDQESWWSVTPEEIAKYTATLCEGKIVADGFSGSGGNVIQFSKFCKKVYAIDIDEKKLDLCRNNANVYECEDNIEFIQSDYLQMINKLKVDYVFLSPPWGGIKYKDSDVYSIKDLMTPNIYDIIKVSLNIAKNIIFFLPRTLLLDELFDILSTILNSNNSGSGDRIFFDVHVLKSAKKIKALMIIFGHDIKEINQSDLGEYITFNYPNISPRNLQILITIVKILGNYKFLQTEFYLRKQLFCNYPKNNNYDKVSKSIEPDSLINYFYEIMTEHEKIKLKSFNIMKHGCIHRINRNSHKKNYSVSFPMQSFDRIKNINNNNTNNNSYKNSCKNFSHNNNLNISNDFNTSISINSNNNIKSNNNKRVFYPIKEIQIEYLSNLPNNHYKELKDHLHSATINSLNQGNLKSLQIVNNIQITKKKIITKK